MRISGPVSAEDIKVRIRNSKYFAKSVRFNIVLGPRNLALFPSVKIRAFDKFGSQLSQAGQNILGSRLVDQVLCNVRPRL